jgi:serralysin
VPDIPGDTSTTATVTNGSFTQGTIDSLGDQDWYAITLPYGSSETITVTGDNTLNPTVAIYDSTGTNILASNDDIDPVNNNDARVEYVVTTPGTYYIDVGASNNQSTGNYELVVQQGRPIATYDQLATQLTTYFWGGDIHHFNVTQGGTITVNISTLTSAEQTLALAALKDWTDIIGVNFQQVTSGAQITFSDAEDPSGPIAQTDSTWSDGIISSATVQISKSWVTDYGTSLDSYSFQTYVHEIGHALGLGHEGDYNANANFITDALFANDSWATSIMSYFSQTDDYYFNNQGFSEDYVLTPMIADVLAMQQLYGLSTTTRTGDTIYGFNSNADNPVYNASLYPNAAYLIYDSGGNDTLDYSNATANQLINLNPETFSNVNGQTGNVMIAPGVVIENAKGGSGDDTIIANDANNVLSGGSGNDTLSYETASAGVSVNLALTTAQNTGGSGTDTVSGFENLIGSAYNDHLTGGPTTVSISGGAGDDVIDGGTANPASRLTLTGGDGNDTFLIGTDTGPFVIDGGSGYNVVDGSNASGPLLLTTNYEVFGGNDILGNIQEIIGSNYGDTLQAPFAGATLIGGGGDDVLTGGDGTFLAGGTGNDTYIVSSNVQITENPGEGIDTVNAIGNYTLGANLENLTLHEYIPWDPYAGATYEPMPSEDWTATGNSLANVITGNLGNDVLTGLGGADTLTGGGGNDIFKDTAAGLNGDTITDLGPGDKIIITDATVGNFTATISGTQLTYTAGSLTLSNSPGMFVSIAAAAGGGVELQIIQNRSHFVANDGNGDHISDILWRNDNGNFTDWLGASNGGFSSNAVNELNGVSTSWQIAGTGDFNGDGRVDVLWRNNDGRITDWLGAANGSFTDNAANALNGVSTDWHIAGIGDFNGDGISDILWRNTDGRVTDWLGNLNGGFTPNSSQFYDTVSTDWKIVGTGDFNGDGYTDIMWRNVDGRITNWLGTANGSFTDNVANAYNGVSLDWHVAGIGDFNGDGRDDILWLNSDGRVTDWLSTANGGYQPNSANFYTSLGTNWQVANVGDYNGDGRADILWRSSDGRMTDWLGTGSGSFTDNAANALTSVDAHWHIAPESQGFF